MLGEPAEGDLEDAAPLPGANGIDVQARERAGLVARQRVREGRSRPHALRHVLHDLPEPPAGRDLAEDDEGALERQARLHQGGKLLREVQDVAGGHARRAEQPPAGPPLLVRRLDAQRIEVLAVESLDDGVGVERLHHPVDRPAGPVGRPIGEDRH